ncbi:hypothetical protein AHMF7605_27810 [Adhaeribacter arboris]|uniref:Outer membrane protein beta-barrel domain-containing protein n=1 Tax=Adhaeribacter arboris TaxID=2072846 RepID=A0A2T2YND7_9BACT|nr:hypothetical protein [Adhaeribacter arboris]PSR57020.1 hypothetical protein AHMF7605_27810 [Adhaeribacter arboris]
MRYLLLFFLLVSTIAYSQTNQSSLKTFVKKGTYLVGGSVNGSFRSYSRTATSTEANPDRGTVVDFKGDLKAGYFITSNIAVGLQASINHFNYKNELKGTGPISTLFLYGPFVRGYLKNGLFGETGFSIGLENLNSTVDSKLIEGKVALGYTHFLNQKVAIEPLLSFRYLQNNYPTSTGAIRQTEFGPTFGVAIHAFLYRGKMGIHTERPRHKY